MPVLPRLIVELAHVSLEDAARIGGYMLAAYAVTQFFAGPVLGTLGDSFGRRPVLLFSMLAFAADYALMAAAPTIAWLFVGRMIAGYRRRGPTDRPTQCSPTSRRPRSAAPLSG
jgi:DHA1 family tetracycline resistance protein-like MFS transporter